MIASTDEHDVVGPADLGSGPDTAGSIDAEAVRPAHRDGLPSAMEQLMVLTYDDLRGLASAWFREQPVDHTLGPTALVHESFLRLVARNDLKQGDRAHFLAAATVAMRRVLIDYARGRQSAKRGGDWRRITLERLPLPMDNGPVDVLAFDEALVRLTALYHRHGRVAELRFIGGLSVRETAQVLGVSDRTVELDTRVARAWLRRELSGGDAE